MKNQLRAINLELNSNKESAPNKEDIILPQSTKSTNMVIFHPHPLNYNINSLEQAAILAQKNQLIKNQLVTNRNSQADKNIND